MWRLAPPTLIQIQQSHPVPCYNIVTYYNMLKYGNLVTFCNRAVQDKAVKGRERGWGERESESNKHKSCDCGMEFTESSVEVRSDGR
jgi:hypothetical protein